MRSIIIATLSSFEEGTVFSRFLREGLKELYDPSDNDLLKKNRFYSGKRDSVDDILIDESYGGLAGLDNLGIDFHYRIKPRSKGFFDNAKKLIGEGNFNYFAELGKVLPPRSKS